MRDISRWRRCGLSPLMPHLKACVFKPLRETGLYITWPGPLFWNSEAEVWEQMPAVPRSQRTFLLPNSAAVLPPLCLYGSRPIQESSPGTWALGADAVMETRTEASRGPELLRTLHTYSPESAGDTWCSRSLEPWAWATVRQRQRSRNKMLTKSPGRLGARLYPPTQVCKARPQDPQASLPGRANWGSHTASLISHLMMRGEAPPSLMPCDLGMGVPRDHTIQIQGLSFSHM